MSPVWTPAKPAPSVSKYFPLSAAAQSAYKFLCPKYEEKIQESSAASNQSYYSSVYAQKYGHFHSEAAHTLAPRTANNGDRGLHETLSSNNSQYTFLAPLELATVENMSDGLETICNNTREDISQDSFELAKHGVHGAENSHNMNWHQPITCAPFTQNIPDTSCTKTSRYFIDAPKTHLHMPEHMNNICAQSNTPHCKQRNESSYQEAMVIDGDDWSSVCTVDSIETADDTDLNFDSMNFQKKVSQKLEQPSRSFRQNTTPHGIIERFSNSSSQRRENNNDGLASRDIDMYVASQDILCTQCSLFRPEGGSPLMDLSDIDDDLGQVVQAPSGDINILHTISPIRCNNYYKPHAILPNGKQNFHKSVTPCGNSNTFRHLTLPSAGSERFRLPAITENETDMFISEQAKEPSSGTQNSYPVGHTGDMHSMQMSKTFDAKKTITLTNSSLPGDTSLHKNTTTELQGSNWKMQPEHNSKNVMSVFGKRIQKNTSDRCFPTNKNEKAKVYHGTKSMQSISTYFKTPDKPPSSVHKKNLADNGTFNKACVPLDGVTCKDFCVQDIMTLSDDVLEDLCKQLCENHCIVLTLVYSDGSTQLREPKLTQKRKRGVDDVPQTVSALLIGSTGYNDISSYSQLAKWEFVSLPLDDTSVLQKYRYFLDSVLSCSSRKVCFDAQELISTLMDVFDFENKDEHVNKWLVHGPKLGSWLLNPDKPPSTFTELCNIYGITMNTYVHSKCTVRSETEEHCKDLQLLAQAMEVLLKRLETSKLRQLYTDIEVKLIPLLAVMEHRKIMINMEKLMHFSHVLLKKLTRLEKKAHEAAGQTFLINSHQQLRQILFETLKLDTKLPANTKLTKTAGNLKSTSEAVLTTLQDLHPLPKIILEHRQLQKLKSTYVDGLLTYIRDGYLSTHWDQTSAATGRLISTSPNLQSVPKIPVEIVDWGETYIIGKECPRVSIFAREPFISPDGWSFLAADFCQIELRLLAHLSGDNALLNIFNDKKAMDIFKELTCQWLCKPVDEVTIADREQTKRVVYSVMYGVGKNTLAEYLKVKPEDAKAVIQSFLLRFPGVNAFTRSCVDLCKRQGYVTTIFGRRRLIPNINHQSAQLRCQAERQAVNFCIQGSAADVCKTAMIQVNEALLNSDVKAVLLLQIHDELLLEVPDNRLEEVKDTVRRIMKSSEVLCGQKVKLKIPLDVCLSTGKSWAHMEEV